MKSLRFANHTYIGDPINAVRIFNDLEVDELMVLDTTASSLGESIPISLVRDLAGEATMPLTVGGGIRRLSHISDLISLGVERVVIGRQAVVDPGFIRHASENFGSSTISVCIDVRTDWLGRNRVASLNARERSGHSPVRFAQLMQEHGAGEIVLQSVNNDGTMDGFDLRLIKEVAESITIPVVALGGASGAEDFRRAHDEALASAMAAGSIFVFHRKRGAVLINYSLDSRKPA